MDERTIIYKNVRRGDWVRCNNCESYMLLPTGADRCPECGAEGTLSWASDNDEFQMVDACDIGFPNYIGSDVVIEDCFSTDIV